MSDAKAGAVMGRADDFSTVTSTGALIGALIGAVSKPCASAQSRAPAVEAIAVPRLPAPTASLKSDDKVLRIELAIAVPIAISPR